MIEQRSLLCAFNRLANFLIKLVDALDDVLDFHRDERCISCGTLLVEIFTELFEVCLLLVEKYGLGEIGIVTESVKDDQRLSDIIWVASQEIHEEGVARLREKLLEIFSLGLDFVQ